jgi:hypothetical protein
MLDSHTMYECRPASYFSICGAELRDWMDAVDDHRSLRSEEMERE